MDGISRVTGSPVEIPFRGKNYLIRGMAAEDWGTVEQHLLSKRPNPLHVAQMAAIDTATAAEERARAITDPAKREIYLEQVQRVIEKSMERAVAEARRSNTATAKEVLEYIETPQGLAFIFWIAFEKSYPQEFRLEEMYELFADMGEESRKQLSDKMAAASGMDQLGN